MGAGYGTNIPMNGLVLAIDPANPRSYYKNLVNSSATSTLNNSIAKTRAYQGAFSLFSSTSDYLSIERPNGLVAGGQISISIWAKWTTVGTTGSTIQVLVDNNHAYNRAFVIQDRPDLSKKLTFFIGRNSNGLQSTGIVGDGRWHHIVVTNDGTTSKMYIDGVLNNSLTESGGLPNNLQPNITLGKWQGGTRYFNGNIGSTLIYNRALSANEVLYLYNINKDKYTDFPYQYGDMQVWLDGMDNGTMRQLSTGSTAVVNTNDPVGYWGDKSGNGYNVLQATTSNRPLYKFNSNGGHAYFNGDTNASCKLATSSTSILTGLGSFSTFTVYFEDFAVINFGHVFIYGNYLRIRTRSGRGYNDYNNGNANNVSGMTTAPLGIKVVATVRQNDGTNLNSWVYVNGVQTASHTITLATARGTTAGAFTIGNANYGNEPTQGGIHEHISYARYFTASEVQALTNALIQKWQIS